MNLRIARIFLIAILITALVFPPTPALACGPDFTGPLFFSTTGPEIAYADYARGRLELLQHTYWHEPLFIAYRNLSDNSFTPAELKMLTAPSPEEAASPKKDWIEIWKDTRTKLVGKPQENQRLYSGGYGVARLLQRSDTYLEYFNCLDNAFENAVQTLTKRVDQFGAQSAVVKNWIAAQDQVFENCSDAPGYPPKPKPAIIPAAALSSDSELIRADRAYQIAAAHFYAGEYAAAQLAFEAIAKDSASPYHRLAYYLVARALVRKGTLDTGDEEYDPQALGQAEAQLRAVLADKNLAEMHDPAERLLGFVRIRLHRQQRFHELESSLSSERRRENISPGFDRLSLAPRSSRSHKNGNDFSGVRRTTSPQRGLGGSNDAPQGRRHDRLDFHFPAKRRRRLSTLSAALARNEIAAVARGRDRQSPGQ